MHAEVVRISGRPGIVSGPSQTTTYDDGALRRKLVSIGGKDLRAVSPCGRWSPSDP